ncbi:MAG: hypothetical protein HOM25_13220 [Rhodospirillaceae bacterium]|nr:hypothetical protein [Rhodospirillaceae bacterium]
MTNNPETPQLSNGKPWAERLRSVPRTFRKLGLAGGSAVVLQNIFPEWVLSGKACLVTYRDFRPFAKAEDEDEDLGVRLFRPEDQPRIAYFDNTSWNFFKQMPKEDWDSYVLEVDGELVGATWFHRRHFSPFPWLNFTVPNGAIAHCNHVVSPAHRRKAYPMRMRTFAIRRYLKEGITFYLASMYTNNFAARGSSAATGSKIVGRLWYVNFFGWKLVGHDGKLRLGRWSPERRLIIPLSIPDFHTRQG